MSRKHILLTYLGFVTLLLLTTFFVMQQTGVSRDFIEHIVGRFLMRDRFRLKRADIDLAEGVVTLEGLEVSSTGEHPLVAVESVKVAVTTNPLGEVGTVQTITLTGLRLNLDVSSGSFPDLGQILRQTEEEVGTTTDLSGGLPPIHVADSTIILRLSKTGSPVEFSEVKLSLVPESPGSTTMVLGGSMLSPSGFNVSVSGSGDVARQEFRGVLAIDDFPITPKTAGHYSHEVENFLEQSGIVGTAKKLAIWLEYSGATEPVTFDAGVQIALQDIDCSAPQLPYPLRNADANITATTKSNGTLRFFLENHSVDGDITVQGLMTELFDGKPAFSTRVQARDLLIGPKLREALVSQEFLRPIWAAFRPSSGRLTADARIWNAEPGSTPKFALDLDLEGVTCSYYGFPNRKGELIAFPHQLTNGTGRLQIRDDMVYIRGVRLGIGTGQVTVTGAIQVPNEEQKLRIDLDIDGRRIAFSDDIRSALHTLLPVAATYYDEYNPSGEANAQVGLHTNKNGDGLDVLVAIRPLGAQATYVGFPYRIDEISGLIEISGRGTAIDLEGVRGETRVDLHGRFRTDPAAGAEGDLRSEFWLQAKDITIDSDLRRGLAALGPDLALCWDTVHPRGRAGCELSLWRDSNAAAWSYDVRVDLDGASVVVDQFPVRITGLQGPLFVHGTGDVSRLEVSAVHGEVSNLTGELPGRLLVQGVVDITSAGTALNLTSVLRHLALDDQLASALHDNGAFQRAAWDILKPSGYVDVIARLQKTETQALPDFKLRLHLNGVGSSAEILPSRATNLHGEVTVSAGVAQFHDIRGKIGHADIHLPTGSARYVDGATSIEVKLSSPDFPVDHRLANMLSGPMKQTFLDRNISGSLKVSELNLSFKFPDVGSGFTSRASGRFSSKNLRLTLGAELQNITGSWNIEDARFDENGGTVRGGLQNGALTILDHRIGSIRTRFIATPERVVFEGIRARLHNGKLLGIGADNRDLTYEFTPSGELSFDLGWEGISLAQIMRHAGVPGDPYHGSLSGELHLEMLEGDDLVEAHATGSMNIREGRLGEVPIFTAIYSYLSPSRRPRFDSASMRFTIRDRMIYIDEFNASSPLLAAEGKGTVTLDGYVDMSMDFPDLFGTKADWLILPPVVRTLTNTVVGFQIYGYLRSPKARPRWLWQDPPDRVHLGPIPARRPDKSIPRKQPQ